MTPHPPSAEPQHPSHLVDTTASRHADKQPHTVHFALSRVSGKHLGGSCGPLAPGPGAERLVVLESIGCKRWGSSREGSAPTVRGVGL